MTEEAGERNLSQITKGLCVTGIINIEEWKILFLLPSSVVYPHHLDQGRANNKYSINIQ